MFKNKNNYIPKYLHKRKIEIIRLKILKRKYGYFFYRKTTSNVLPSQAIKYYRSRLKINMFNRWKHHWYKERIEWKLVIRAEIHYNLTQTYKSLQKWKCFILSRKSSIIKSQIAYMHFSRNCSRQLLLHALSKWKLFMKCRLYERTKEKIAKDFFKSKCTPEMLKTYMCRWIIYTRVSRKNRHVLLESMKYHERIMISKVFQKLKNYVDKKKVYKNITQQAQKIFEKNLQLRAFLKLKTHTRESLHEKQNLLLASTHFFCQLKRNCFSKLRENRNRNYSVRASLEKIESRRNFVIKRRYFEHFKIYHKQKIMKVQKIAQAISHFEGNLKKLILRNWISYIKYRSEKKQKTQQILNTVAKHIDINKGKFVLLKWKYYTQNQLRKKRKMEDAEKFYKQHILQTYLNWWKEFVIRKTSKRFKMDESCVFHTRLLLKTHFRFWKCFVDGNNHFREKIKHASEFYQSKMIKDGVLLIVKSGLNRKEKVYQIFKEKLSCQLFLAQKYLSRWKQRTIYNKNAGLGQAAKYLEENKENIEHSSSVEWYSICFLAPRVATIYENTQV